MKDAAVDLWALDEVHFQQQGSRCRMWVPPENKDPIVYHHPTRKSVGYFGAVRLRDGALVFRRETGRFNGESFGEFLKQLQQASAVANRRVLVISDKPRIIALDRTWTGGYTTPRSSAWTSCRPIAPNSTPSSESGSSPAAYASTIATSAFWKASSRPSKPASTTGPNPTIPSGVYAQLLKTLCLAGYAVVMRSTTAPFWEREIYAGKVNEYLFPDVSIDDYVFGVKAIDSEGNESLVSPYVPPSRTKRVVEIY